MSSDRPVPTLASCLARDSGRAFQQRMERARYYVGIDLGTTNSSVTVVDALALLRGDTDAAVRLLPVRQATARGAIESPYLPSVVAELQPRCWSVGQGAREARSRGLLRNRQIFYSTKLEMGLGREPFYPSAGSPEYDSPYKVAGRILQELRQAVEEEVGEEGLKRVVVTVPASFQLAARKDTFRAAKLAGLELQEQSLLDEPNAAFLDWVLTCRHATEDGGHFDFTRSRNVLVFDFGGGTCDVSILRTHADPATQRLELSNLSIARYEQLGGDNIDAAIVEQVLLPQLLQQNGLESLDLTFGEKRERILPQLLGTAEALKLGLCAGKAPDVPGSIQVDLPPRPGPKAPEPDAPPPGDVHEAARQRPRALPRPGLPVPARHRAHTGLVGLRPRAKRAQGRPSRAGRRRRPPARGRKLARPAGREGAHGVLPERGAPAPPRTRTGRSRPSAAARRSSRSSCTPSASRSSTPSRRRAWASSRSRAASSSSSRAAPSCRSRRRARPSTRASSSRAT